MKPETAAKYLKVILHLRETGGDVRSAMVATEMFVSRPTVCVALRQLQKDGLITYDETHEIRLTDMGEAIAQKTAERYGYFLTLLTGLGIPEPIAEKDACLLEYALSDESFAAIRAKTGGI